MVFSLPLRTLCAVLLVGVPLGFFPETDCLAETVMLEFSSPTCGPCQRMRPTVQRLRSDGLPVREVDVTRQPKLASQYGVTQVPTFLVLVDGNPVERVVGETSYHRLHRMLRSALPAPAPKRRQLPQGQSPQLQGTFATPPTTLSAVANQQTNVPPTEFADTTDLSQPQSGRVISLQNPSRRPPTTAVSNPFGNHPAPATTPRVSALSPLHRRLLNATVKISVEDPAGKSAGTGTIVDARSGEALILTCGHIFRDSDGKGPINVMTFRAGPTGATPGESYPGRLIDFDLDRDLALLSIRTSTPVQAVPIAGVQTRPLARSARVTSVGCNHGEHPTAVDSQVTAIDRYQGTPNVEVAGAPVEGRSGGGLFNAAGQLVGVCFAADPQGNEGLYAGLPAIHAKLDSLKLTMVYQPQQAALQVPQTAPSVTPTQAIAAQPPISVRGQEPEAPSAVAAAPALSAAEQAALREIRSRGTKSEVICIIRPQDPTAKSEVITLNNVSPGFVEALTARGARPASTAAQSASRLR